MIPEVEAWEKAKRESKGGLVAGIEIITLLVLTGNDLVSALEKASGVTPTIMDDLESPYDVYLTDRGQKIIACIKEVRQVTSLGLKEAKTLVERTGGLDPAPQLLNRAISEKSALEIVERFAAIGANVEISKSHLSAAAIQEAKDGLVEIAKNLA